MSGANDSTTAGQPLRAHVGSALQFSAVAACIGLAAVALGVVALPHSDAGTVTVRLVGVVLPVAFGLYRLAREPADRFARLLLGAGALWSLTILAESTSSGAYSIGRVSIWLIEPVLVFLILAFPHGRLETP